MNIQRTPFLVLLGVVWLVCACGGNTNSTPPPPPPVPAAVEVTSGSQQAAAVEAAFAKPLVVTVVDAHFNSVGAGVLVTFTAPTVGASGAFAGGVNTATTNANGEATSALFTANGTLGSYTVVANVSGAVNGASFNLTNTVGPPAQVVAETGSGQDTATNTAFIAPLVVEVLDSVGDTLSGVAVTFSVPGSGASGTFAGGANVVTTNASGIATSAVFIANGTAGQYTVTATVGSVVNAADFTLTNAASGAATNYSFFLSGWESGRYGTNPYTLAGSVSIDANGYVLAGEQDYKDDWHAASPEPSGDTILGGLLAVDATSGQGTLTLVTNNAIVGNDGIETLGVQFANDKHALIIQFDGSATSSGTVDFQTLPGGLSGSFSFTLLGTDANDDDLAAGGVFSVSGTSLTNGIYDYDDIGTGTTIMATPFTGTISPPDSFGRGTITITNTNLSSTINYYMVGPEVIRLVVVGPGLLSGGGSAFGQGTSAGKFSNTSIGSSVFGMQSYAGLEAYLYAAVGMFTTNPGADTFQGTADDCEEGAIDSGASISGTYSIASNGYGSLTIQPGNLRDISVLGIYATDPNLNLTDPNNTTSGLGGALVADLDANLNGAGIIIPQTDTSSTSFSGNYVFGARSYTDGFENLGLEADFIAQGSVSDGVLSGTGLTSFIFFDDDTSSPTFSGVSFSATAPPDAAHPGRYVTNANGLVLTSSGGKTVNYGTTVIYQASGEQLFWINENVLTLFMGSFQHQTSLSGLPAQATARK